MIPSRFALALSLLLVSGAARCLAEGPAAPTADAPWMQVELVAFRHMGQSGSAEKWPQNPALAYPPQLEFLLQPGTPEYAAALEAREFDRALQAEAGSAAVAVAPEELARVLLSGTDTALAAAAARIANAPGYKLLAHIAWREPRLAEGTTERVLVTGGASTGDHRELEGSIAITRSHFLHIDADLWLNDFLPAGADPGPQGVDLPPIPQPRAPQKTPAPAGEQADATMALPGALTDADAGLAAGESSEPIMIAPVRAARSVALHASRRLAPGEVHYIDHPLLGLILSIRPYDPAQPSGTAANEPAPALPAQSKP